MDRRRRSSGAGAVAIRDRHEADDVTRGKSMAAREAEHVRQIVHDGDGVVGLGRAVIEGEEDMRRWRRRR